MNIIKIADDGYVNGFARFYVQLNISTYLCILDIMALRTRVLYQLWPLYILFM